MKQTITAVNAQKNNSQSGLSQANCTDNCDFFPLTLDEYIDKFSFESEAVRKRFLNSFCLSKYDELSRRTDYDTLEVQIFHNSEHIKTKMYISHNGGYSLDDFIAKIYSYIDDAIYCDRIAFFYYENENAPSIDLRYQIIFANKFGKTTDEDIDIFYFKIY